MKNVLALFVIAAAVIGIGCGSEAATKTAGSQDSYTASSQKDEANTKALADKMRKERFDSTLTLFNTTSANTSDLKKLQTASQARGWFRIACDLEWNINSLNDDVGVLTQEGNAALLRESGQTRYSLNAKVAPFVASYVYAVAQTSKVPSGGKTRENGCYEGASSDLLDMIRNAQDFATTYNVSVEQNGFAKGEMRTLFLREMKATIAREKLFETLLAKDASEDQKSTAASRLGELLGDDDFDLTDQELGITPQIRQALDDTPLG